MKVSIKRDGIHLIRTVTNTDGTIEVTHARIPDWPKQYGQTVAIMPDAVEEAPNIEFSVMRLLVEQMADTDKELRARKRKPLNLSTVKIYRVAPTDEDPRILLSWKASDG